MKNRKFKIRPQYFLIAVFSGIGGMTLAYFGFKAGKPEPLLAGGLFILVAIVLFFSQFVPIPKLGHKVEAEIARIFPAGSRRKALILLTDGFTDYANDGVFLSMLKFSKGDMNRLKKLSRALNGQDDFREAYPMLEYINKQLDEHETE